MEPTPGITTSEFKFAWLAPILTALVSAGTALIADMDATSVTYLLVAWLLATAGIAIRYIDARAKTKAAASLGTGGAVGPPT